MLLFTAIGYGIFEGFSTGIYQGHMPGIWAVILGIGCLGLCLGSLVYWAVSALVRACQREKKALKTKPPVKPVVLSNRSGPCF